MRITLRSHNQIQQIQNTQDNVVPKLRPPERPSAFSQVQNAKARFISLHIQSSQLGAVPKVTQHRKESSCSSFGVDIYRQKPQAWFTQGQGDWFCQIQGLHYFCCTGYGLLLHTLFPPVSSYFCFCACPSHSPEQLCLLFLYHKLGVDRWLAARSISWFILLQRFLFSNSS